MLEQVLLHIHNRFEREWISGTFEIVGGTLKVEGALDGQYLWIEGSVFNDGLHRYPVDDLADEEFSGQIILLAVPRAVQDLADEIATWQEANGAVLDGPYQSESFGGYSYTRASSSGSSDGSSLSGWCLQFRDRLNPWRKLGCERW